MAGRLAQALRCSALVLPPPWLLRRENPAASSGPDQTVRSRLAARLSVEHRASAQSLQTLLRECASHEFWEESKSYILLSRNDCGNRRRLNLGIHYASETTV